jgi:tetratricopeptide (TPR) repeat protein
MQRFIPWFFYALTLTPLLYWPGLRQPFIAPKLLVFSAMACVFAAYLLLQIANREVHGGLIFWLFFAFIAWLAAAAFAGVDWRLSLWSRPERGIGAVQFAAFFVIFCVALLEHERVNWRRVFCISLAASVACGITAIMQTYIPGFLLFSAGDRPGGLLGNAAFLAGYAMLHVFIALWLALRDSQHYALRNGARRTLIAAFLLAALFNAYVIFLTQTRGAFLGLLAGLAAWGVVHYAARSGSRRALAGASALFIVSAVFCFLFWRDIPLLTRFRGPLDGLSAGRSAAWSAALSAVAARPFAGWGLETFSIAFDELYRPSFTTGISGQVFLSKPHHAVLEYAVAGGIPLAIAYLAFIAALLLSARGAWLGFMVAYAVRGLFMFDDYGSLVVFLLAAAHIAGAAGAPQIAQRPGRSAHTRWAVIAACVFVIGGLGYGAVVRPAEDFDFSARIASASDIAAVRAVLRDMDAALERHPRDYPVRLAYAEAVASLPKLLAQEYASSARMRLSQAAAISPYRPEAWYALAKLEAVAGDVAAMRVALARAIAAHPSNGDAHYAAGVLELSAGDPLRGFASLERAFALGRTTRYDREEVMLGGFYADHGRYADAIRLYTRAVELDPYDADALFRRGIVHYYAGDFAAARTDFALALRANPALADTALVREAEPIMVRVGMTKRE